MRAALLPAVQQRPVVPRTARIVAQAAGCGHPAAPEIARATSAATTQLGSLGNIVDAPQRDQAAPQSRKLALQAEAQRQLQEDNAWWRDAPARPANLVTAATPADYKRLISEAPPDRLVVVDYLKPSCAACRRLMPKLEQVAAANPAALFVKVNVESPEMRALGEGMQVYSLPWFHTFIGGALVSSFSANLHTVDKLRAEVAASKACTDPGCSMY